MARIGEGTIYEWMEWVLPPELQTWELPAWVPVRMALDRDHRGIRMQLRIAPAWVKWALHGAAMGTWRAAVTEVDALVKAQLLDPKLLEELGGALGLDAVDTHVRAIRQGRPHS